MSWLLRAVDPLRWLIRFPRFHRLVHRLTSSGVLHETVDGSLQYPYCAIDRYVWRRLMAEPGFADGLERGKADMAAGRFAPFAAARTADAIRDKDLSVAVTVRHVVTAKVDTADRPS